MSQNKISLTFSTTAGDLKEDFPTNQPLHATKREVMARLKLDPSKADEFIVTKDLRERKAVMEERADAFVALPGGFGTLEEILEILTLKQLEAHGKPVVFLNTNGFFAPLLAMFERLYEERFSQLCRIVGQG